jgi:predicted nucleotidyltransferase
MPYPTDQHRRAAEAAVEFFSAQEGVQAITLICSLARGTATSESDLDLGIVMGPGEKWNSLRKR